MTLMVNMSKPFIVQVKNDKQRRVIIDKKAWEEEGLQKGDYIEVKIRKIDLEERH
jgi:flagellar assembly factor FliW